MQDLGRAVQVSIVLVLAYFVVLGSAAASAAPVSPNGGSLSQAPDAPHAPDVLGQTGSVNDRIVRPMPMPQWRPMPLDTGRSSNAVIYDARSGSQTVVPLPGGADMPSAATSASNDRARSPIASPDSVLHPLSLPSLDGLPDRPGQLQNFSELVRVDDPSEWPWRPHVRLIMRYGKNYMACSGSLIDERHVLTAGHCIFTWNSMVPAGQRVCPGGDTGSCWVDEVQIVPGYRARNAPYGKALNVKILAFEEYTMSQNINWDMAIIFLDRAVGALTGHVDYGYSNDDDFYLSETFNNPGYPAARPYNGEHMYDSSGTYDRVEGVSLIFSRGSFGGQSGSTSHAVDAEGNSVAYAVASTASDKITRHVRFNARIYGSTGSFIDENMPDTADLSSLDVNVSPTNVSAGDSLTGMDYMLHNYSEAAWNGTVRAKYFLSTDKQFGAGDRILKTVSYDASIPPLQSQRVTEDAPPTIPDGLGGGAYYVGVFLDIKDADYGNNTTGQWDVAEIRVAGAAGSPTATSAPIPAMTQTPPPFAGSTAFLPAAYAR